MDEKKVYLTKEQATDCLDIQDGMVHCFLSGGILIGADWELESVKEEIEKAQPGWIEIPGHMAKSMKHAVAVYSEKVKGYCFFASDMDKINALEVEALKNGEDV